MSADENYRRQTQTTIADLARVCDAASVVLRYIEQEHGKQARERFEARAKWLLNEINTSDHADELGMLVSAVLAAKKMTEDLTASRAAAAVIKKAQQS